MLDFERISRSANANGYLLPLDPTGAIMAKQVKLGKGKEFTFAKSIGGGGGVSKYPWDEWFNGDLLLLEQDVTEDTGEKDADGNPVTKLAAHGKKDYDVLTNAMPAKLKTAARKRYKIVQISRRDADGQRLKDSLIIRARDMDAAERNAEDILRAEEKAAKKAAKEEEGGADLGDPNTLPTPQAQAM